MRIRLIRISIFLLIFAGILITFSSNNCVLLALDDKPNVIFIILDAARPDHFSCYGYNETTTAFIDKIRQEGALFQNHFVQHTYTRASLASMFSSRYFTICIPRPDYLLGWKVRLENPASITKQFDAQQIFLTDILSKHGYRTALFSDHYWLTIENWFVRKFDEYFKLPREEKSDLNRELKPPAFITDMASWVKKQKKNKFFLYWHCLVPHRPYRIAREPINRDIDEIIASIEDGRCEDNDCQKDIKLIRTLYDDNLRYADRLVAGFYNELKDSGILDNTLLIITADHGERLFEGHGFEHGEPPVETVLRVPLIIVYPPLIKKGITIKGLTEAVDIMPTILDICGIRLPADKSMDGVSLLEYFSHPDKGKKAVFTEQSIRTKEYKYILPGQLYNIQKDHYERDNLIEKEPAVAKQLEAEYKLKMGTYKKRYENSIRETLFNNPVVNYPLCISVVNFDISDKAHIQSAYERKGKFGEYLKNKSALKQWILNTFQGNEQLVWPSDYPPLPVDLSSTLPDYSYQVYLLIASPRVISSPAEKLGLRYRFNSRERLRYPTDISLVESLGKNNFYYYLSFGETVVRNNKFLLHLDFQPKTKIFYSIIHAKFVPRGVKHDLNAADTPEKKEELRKTIDTLKSLGYL